MLKLDKLNQGEKMEGLWPFRPKPEKPIEPEIKHEKNGPRVIIYGTRTGGAAALAEEFQTYLEEKGIPEPDVETVRSVFQIKDSFFYRSPSDKEKQKVTLPAGVVIFPEMRSESESGMNVTIKTPTQEIIDLCEENKVPFVTTSENDSKEDLREEVFQALEGGQE